MTFFDYHKQNGFALLLSLVIISVVLAVVISIAQLSTKQLQLAGVVGDSELAFNAAYAGVECAQSMRLYKRAELENGDSGIDFDCFDTTHTLVAGYPDSYTNTDTGYAGDGEVHHYQYQLDWTSGGNELCAIVDMVIFDTVLDGANLSVTDTEMIALIEGYPGTSDKECIAGSQCTTVAVQGYDRACSDITQPDTIQRSVLLEY